MNTIHNLHYYQDLMKGLREAIANQKLDEFVAAFYEGIGQPVPPLND